MKVNSRNKWCLSLGCIGRDLTYTLVSLFLLTYLQYTGLFTTAQFSVVTIIIVLCRIWDGINDPMMGTIITNTKTKFGKYRPWVLSGAIINAVVLVLLFSVRFSQDAMGGWANVIFIGVMYLLWGMTFTMNDISYWDLLPALTSEKKERDTLTTLVAVFASLGAFISGGLIPIVTPGNMIAAYRMISIIWAIVFVACQFLIFFGVHDNKQDKFMVPVEEQDDPTGDEKVTLGGMVKILFNNKQLLVMAVVVLLYSLGSAILNAFGQNFFYSKFGYMGDGENLGGSMMTIFTVIYAAGTLVSQALYPKFASKFKRNQLVAGSIILLAAGYILFFLMANILTGMVCFIVLCILGILIFVGQGIFYLTMLVMLTNTIEYDEWQTGKNHSAIAFTVRPFMVKLAGAIQYGVVALTLIICGLYTTTSKVGEAEIAVGMYGEAYKLEGEAYTDAMQEIKDYLETTEIPTDVQVEFFDMAAIYKAKGQVYDGDNLRDATKDDVIWVLNNYSDGVFSATPGQIWGLTAVMCILPIALFFIAVLVIKKKYIIDEEMYEKICREIAERKGEVIPEAKSEALAEEAA